MIEIDPASATPPYAQIRAQIEAQAEHGALPAGTRLPPVRQLASELGVAPGTVAKAYRELEQAGVVITKGRLGTLVAGRSARVDAAQRRRRLDAAAGDFVTQAAALGATVAEAADAVRRAARTRLPDA